MFLKKSAPNLDGKSISEDIKNRRILNNQFNKPILDAIKKCDWQEIQTLIESNIDNAQIIPTAFSLAINNGASEIFLDYLVENCPDIDTHFNFSHMAEALGDEKLSHQGKVINLEMRLRYDRNFKKNNNTGKYYDKSTNKPAVDTIKGRNNVTLLISAIDCGDTETAMWLIETQGADFNLAMDYNVTPLMVAAKKAPEKFFTYLISKGANIDTRTSNQYRNTLTGMLPAGSTAWYFAIRFGNVSAITALLNDLFEKILILAREGSLSKDYLLFVKRELDTVKFFAKELIDILETDLATEKEIVLHSYTSYFGDPKARENRCHREDSVQRSTVFDDDRFEQMVHVHQANLPKLDDLKLIRGFISEYSITISAANFMQQLEIQIKKDVSAENNHIVNMDVEPPAYRTMPI
jgi:hypothetical protein